MYGGETDHKLPIIIPRNYLIKGRKYLMFVDIRKVDYLVDKLQINFVLFIYYIIIYIFIYFFHLIIYNSMLILFLLTIF